MPSTLVECLFHSLNPLMSVGATAKAKYHSRHGVDELHAHREVSIEEGSEFW